MAVHHRRYNNNNNTCIKRNQSSSFANVRQQTLMENWTTSSTLKCNWQCSSCCWEPLEKIEITTKLFIIKDHQWIELLLYSEENHQLHRKSWNVHLMALSQHNSLGRLLNRLKVTLQTLAYMLLQNPSNSVQAKKKNNNSRMNFSLPFQPPHSCGYWKWTSIYMEKGSSKRPMFCCLRR